MLLACSSDDGFICPVEAGKWVRHPHPKTGTYLGARYARLVPRVGKQKTIVAVEHSILIAAWHMLTNNVDYQDLGGDYFTKQDPERTI